MDGNPVVALVAWQQVIPPTNLGQVCLYQTFTVQSDIEHHLAIWLFGYTSRRLESA